MGARARRREKGLVRGLVVALRWMRRTRCSPSEKEGGQPGGTNWRCLIPLCRGGGPTVVRRGRWFLGCGDGKDDRRLCWGSSRDQVNNGGPVFVDVS